jgi:hypothetical protein
MADFDYLPATFNVPSVIGASVATVISNSGTLATGALAINKTSRVLRVPAGFKLSAIRFRIGDGDSNGSPALVFTIGDTGDPDRLVTLSTTGQAGGELTALADTGFLYEFTADTDIDVTVTTAAATAVAAAFKIALTGTLK